MQHRCPYLNDDCPLCHRPRTEPKAPPRGIWVWPEWCPIEDRWIVCANVHSSEKYKYRYISAARLEKVLDRDGEWSPDALRLIHDLHHLIGDLGEH